MSESVELLRQLLIVIQYPFDLLHVGGGVMVVDLTNQVVHMLHFHKYVLGIQMDQVLINVGERIRQPTELTQYPIETVFIIIQSTFQIIKLIAQLFYFFLNKTSTHHHSLLLYLSNGLAEYVPN